MTKLWQKGKISAVDFQQGAAASSGDVPDDPVLAKISRIDAGGKFNGHGHRDLLRILGKFAKMPPTYQALIDVWDEKTNRKTQSVMNFLLPFVFKIHNPHYLHELIQYSDL